MKNLAKYALIRSWFFSLATLALLLAEKPNGMTQGIKETPAPHKSHASSKARDTKGRDYCAIAAARKREWEQSWESAEVASRIAIRRFISLQKESDDQVSVDTNDPDLKTASKASMEARKKQEVAYERYLDSIIPILTILGHSEERVMMLRSYLPGGLEYRKAWESQHGIAPYYFSSKSFGRNRDDAMHLFDSFGNKEIPGFCHTHGIVL